MTRFSLMPFLLAAFLLIACLPAHAQTTPPPAQNNPFSSERPGFTNGAETVAPRRLQFEGGYTYLPYEGGHEHRIADAALLRVGLGKTTEFRVGLPNIAFTHSSGGSDTHGFTDTSLGTKWRFLQAAKGRPSAAFIVQTSLPTGEPAYRASHLQPQIALEAAYALSDVWSVQSDLIYTRAYDGGTQYDQWAGGLNFGRSLTDTTGVFLETYRIAPSGGANAPNGNYIDGGITYLLNTNTQLDFNLGTGITSFVKNDHFFGVGVARRW